MQEYKVGNPKYKGAKYCALVFRIFPLKIIKRNLALQISITGMRGSAGLKRKNYTLENFLFLILHFI
jgi:hypothetical protein